MTARLLGALLILVSWCAAASAQLATTAPTAPAGDSSDKIANTRWVSQNAGPPAPSVTVSCPSTGDCAPAINTALAQTINGQPVNAQMQAGTFLLQSAVTIPLGQCLFGAGVGNTILVMNQTFSPAAPGEILVTGRDQNGACIHDLQFQDTEPNTATGTLSTANIAGTTITAVVGSGSPANGNLIFDNNPVNAVIAANTTLSAVTCTHSPCQAGDSLSATVSIPQVVSPEAMSTGLARSQFLPLGSCDAVTTGCAYPPNILIQGNSFRFWNLRFYSTWNSIANAVGNKTGRFFIDNIEDGALNVGLNIFSSFDAGHIVSYHHHWQFGAASGPLHNLWLDGNNFGAIIGAPGTVGGISGEADGIRLVDYFVENARTQVNNNETFAVDFVAPHFSDSNSTFEMTDSTWVHLLSPNFVGAAFGANTNCQINITGGTLFVDNPWLSTKVGSTLGEICAFNTNSIPHLILVGGKSQVNVPNVTVMSSANGGTFSINGHWFDTATAGNGAWTNPVISAGPNVAVQFNANLFDASPSGGNAGALAIATDLSLSSVNGNNWNGWLFNRPGNNGFYGNNSDALTTARNINVGWTQTNGTVGQTIIGDSSGNLNFTTNGVGTLQINGTPGVSCPSNSTVTSVKGLVTGCSIGGGGAGMATDASNSTSVALANLLGTAGTVAQTAQGAWTFNGLTSNALVTIPVHAAPSGIGQPIDLYVNAKNTSTTVQGYGELHDWFSNYAGTGFEVGWGFIGDLNAITSIVGTPAYTPMWLPVVCPNNTANAYGCGSELDVGYQGTDYGWVDRPGASAEWATALLFSPSCNNFYGESTHGNCVNSLAPIAVMPDATLGRQWYNGFLCGYRNSVSAIAAGGYCLYGTGDKTGTNASFTGTIAGHALTVSAVTGTVAIGQQVFGAGVTANTIIDAGSGTSWTVNNSLSVGPVAMTSNAYPFAPTGFAGTFLHGVQLQSATFNDGIAVNAGTNTIVAGGITSSGNLNLVSGGGGQVLINGATIVNTGTSPALAQYQGAGSTTVGPATISGDLTIAAGGAGTVTKSNGNTILGMAFQAPSAVAMTGGTASSLTLTNLPSCVNPGDACPKSYIDATQQNGNPHAPVAYATAAALPNTPTYNNGAGTLTDSTTGSVLVVDGVNQTTLNTRFLVKTQAAAAQNGIYALTTVGVGGTTPWVLTRALDFNTVAAGNIATGANTFVCATCYGLTAGVTNDTKTFAMNTTGTITLGTTALNWVQISNTTTYLATAPLTLTSNTFGFQNIPATSVPANTTAGSATPSGSIAYGAGANQLLQLNGSGLVPAATIPASGASTLGGVNSFNCAAHQVTNTLSTGGVFGCVQLGFGDLSGTITLAQFPPVTGPTILGRVTNTSGAASAAYTPSNGADTTVPLVHAAASGQCAQFIDGVGTLGSTACSGAGGAAGFIPSTYFVATAANGGNDSTGTGTYAAPFATLAHAISVASGGAKKTIYVRAGTYSTASSGTTCRSNLFGIGITAGNEGLTIQYWPPDGIDTAIFDFSGVPVGFCVYNGGNGVSIIGLKVQNAVDSPVRVSGGTVAGQGATGVTISDNVITGTTGTFGGGIELVGNVQGAKILRNDIENIATQGIMWTDSGVGDGGGSGLDIEYNYIRNACIGAGDCGSIYLQNIQCSVGGPCSSGQIIAHNYMTGAVAGAYGIYLDDWASYVTVEYNTILIGSSTAGFPNCAIIHGGQNNVFRYNICDIGGAGGAMTNAGPLVQQTSTHGTPTMLGNVFQDSIIIGNSTSSPAGAGFKTFSCSSGCATTNPPNPADVRNNLFWNINNQSGGVSGINNTAGTGATADGNPTGANPQIRCYLAAVDQSSPAFAAPVYFSGPGYYQPGPAAPAVGNANFPFPLPQTGTAPSWGSSC